MVARDQPFGTVLGTNNDVPAYSCDYETWQVPKGQREWRNFHEGVFTGAKWQCVEYARRWLLINKGCTFRDLPMAYNIMELSDVTIQRGEDKGRTLPLRAHHNGKGAEAPTVGSMLIWASSYDGTGHVAIITEVGRDFVRVAEQNFEDWMWPEGANYARELKLSLNDGVYTVHDKHEILGWQSISEEAASDYPPAV